MAGNDIKLFPVPNGAGPNDIQLDITPASGSTEARFQQVGVEVWQPNDTPISTTPARFLQVGNEVWGTFNPAARFQQVGNEVWGTFNPAARFTQVGLEVWIGVGGNPRRLVNVYFL